MNFYENENNELVYCCEYSLDYTRDLDLQREKIYKLAKRYDFICILGKRFYFLDQENAENCAKKIRQGKHKCIALKEKVWLPKSYIEDYKLKKLLGSEIKDE